MIIHSALSPEPDKLNLARLPKMDSPLTIRYGATQPAILNHFELFNRCKPYELQVKPFNFLLRLQATDEFKHFAPIAPYDKDVAKAHRKAFDRRTGERITKPMLKTVLEGLRQFHTNPEHKSDHGGRQDHGPTERRHVRVTGVEHIGKEADRWEDSLYSGESGEAVNYGSDPSGKAAFIQAIADASEEFGPVALAKASRVSRKEITRIVNGESEARPETRGRLVRAITRLSDDQRAHVARQATEVAAIHDLVTQSGASRTATQLEVDRRNLRAILNGKRAVPTAVSLRLRTIVDES
ncbi:MAG: hypothetical protein ACYC96_15550 [Fimbriimonadaceae bacterium]